MKHSKLLILVFVLLQAFGAALAGAQNSGKDSMANIKILSPADNSRVDAGEEYQLKYEIALGKGDDHFHVWVDDSRGPGIHDTKGTYTLPKMSPGKHIITIKFVDKGHVPTGPQKSITVIAK